MSDAGGAIGGVVGFLTVCGVIWCVCRCCRRPDPDTIVTGGNSSAIANNNVNIVNQVTAPAAPQIIMMPQAPPPYYHHPPPGAYGPPPGAYGPPPGPYQPNTSQQYLQGHPSPYAWLPKLYLLNSLFLVMQIGLSSKDYGISRLTYLDFDKNPQFLGKRIIKLLIHPLKKT